MSFVHRDSIHEIAQRRNGEERCLSTPRPTRCIRGLRRIDVCRYVRERVEGVSRPLRAMCGADYDCILYSNAVLPVRVALSVKFLNAVSIASLVRYLFQVIHLVVSNSRPMTIGSSGFQRQRILNGFFFINTTHTHLLHLASCHALPWHTWHSNQPSQASQNCCHQSKQSGLEAKNLE